MRQEDGRRLDRQPISNGDELFLSQWHIDRLIHAFATLEWFVTL